MTDREARARWLVAQLTLAEKISLVDGRAGWPVDAAGRLLRPPPGEVDPASVPSPGSVGADGYVPAIPRLGIPALHLSGAGSGLTDMCRQRGDLGTATAFPAPIAQTATWDPELTEDFGAALAREARQVGINVLLGAACNLVVDPWCGRTFEYHGEDPLLSGTMTAGELRGGEREGVLTSIKHFAGNFQETGRFFVDTVIAERTLRQGELRAFEVALELSRPAAVMGAYNKVNGTYACEHDTLLNRILKQEWGFDGWVMSDWGATHSTELAALSGLDQEFPMGHFFGEGLARAVADGTVPQSRLDDMCLRILRQVLTLDDAPAPPLDTGRSLDLAQRLAEQGTVLLRNTGVLPLDPQRPGSLLLVGAHADVAVMSGAGSSTVWPRAGDPVTPDSEADAFRSITWLPSSLLTALAAELPGWRVFHDPGDDEERLLALRDTADLCVVVVHQHMGEDRDQPDVRLPDDQDQRVRLLCAGAAPVVVVLQTGGPVLMPWADTVAAVLAAWYPGERGAEALAAILAGRVDPGGRLPVTFPASEEQLPRPVPPPIPVRPGSPQPGRPTSARRLRVGGRLPRRPPRPDRVPALRRRGSDPRLSVRARTVVRQFRVGPLRGGGADRSDRSPTRRGRRWRRGPRCRHQHQHPARPNRRPGLRRTAACGWRAAPAAGRLGCGRTRPRRGARARDRGAGTTSGGVVGDCRAVAAVGGVVRDQCRLVLPRPGRHRNS